MLPEDVRLVTKEDTAPMDVDVDVDVDRDLLGCCLRDLTVGCVPLLLLLIEQSESLLSDFTSLLRSDRNTQAYQQKRPH